MFKINYRILVVSLVLVAAVGCATYARSRAEPVQHQAFPTPGVRLKPFVFPTPETPTRVRPAELDKETMKLGIAALAAVDDRSTSQQSPESRYEDSTEERGWKIMVGIIASLVVAALILGMARR